MHQYTLRTCPFARGLASRVSPKSCKEKEILRTLDVNLVTNVRKGPKETSDWEQMQQVKSS